MPDDEDVDYRRNQNRSRDSKILSIVFINVGIATVYELMFYWVDESSPPNPP